MSRKSDSEVIKRKAKQAAKKGVAKAKVQIGKLQASAKVGFAKHARAFKLAAKRYQVALKNS